MRNIFRQQRDAPVCIVAAAMRISANTFRCGFFHPTLEYQELLPHTGYSSARADNLITLLNCYFPQHRWNGTALKAPSLPAANENTRPMESSPPQSDSAVVYPVPLEAADPNVLLNQLVEAVPQLVWSTRADGWCDYFNQKWYEYTGASFVEHGGIGWQNALYPDDLARTVAAWQSAVESGSPFEVEYRLRRADGVYRWFLARGLPIRDASGQVVRWFGTSTDIEEQKQGEARQRFLAELSERTRLLSNPEEVLLTALTLLGNYLDVARASYDDIDLANDLVRVGVEYRREDRPPISGSFPLSSFGPEMVADLTAGRTVLLPDTSQDPRTRQTFDTQYQPLQVRAFIAAPVIKDGVLVRVLSVSVTGPRVWTEEEAALVSAVAERTWLAAENARLYQAARQEIAERRRAEERYRSLTDAMVSVVWSTGPNGLFIQPQPSWEAYTGQGWEEQKEGRAISALHPEDREKASRVWYEAVRAVRPFESEQRLWNAASQQFRWCTVRGVPLKNADGSVREWVGVHTDIHERRLRAEMQNLLAMMNEHILTLTDPNEILWRVINLVGEELTLNRCHFIEVDFRAGFRHHPAELPARCRQHGRQYPKTFGVRFPRPLGRSAPGPYHRHRRHREPSHDPRFLPDLVFTD